jgi:hypothetical protein
MSAGFTKSKNISRQKSESGTRYPFEFLDALAKSGLGGPFSTDQLLSGLGGTTNLFTGQQVGLFGGGGAQPGGQQGQRGAQPRSMGGQQFFSGEPTAARGGPGMQFFAPGGGGGQELASRGGAGNGNTNGPTLTPERIIQLTQGDKDSSKALDKVLDAIFAGKLDPSQPLSLEQIKQLVGSGRLDNARDTIGADIGNQAALADARRRSQETPFTASGPGGLPLDNAAAIRNLRFGDQLSPTPHARIRDLPRVNAPTVAAAEANIAPTGFDALQRSLFESNFRPQEREIQQRGALADRQTRAEQAQSGTASSAAGQGLLLEQRRQRDEQLNFQSGQAANAATQQRFGLEFEQAQANAERQQQTHLAQAGFDFNSQLTNAQNVLAGDVAKADNYLKTIGLDAQTASQARNDFLGLLGVQQSELARLDASTLAQLGLVLNTWMQQVGLLGNLGQFSTGESDARGESISQSAGVSGGGGGG